MKSEIAKTIDKVVDEVLQLGESAIKVEDTKLLIAGCWDKDENGNEAIKIFFYVNGQEVFSTTDIGTKLYC